MGLAINHNDCAGQDVFDMVKGEDDGEGQLYIEGMDEAFMEWRRSHGAEWARYYGLRVRVLEVLLGSTQHPTPAFLSVCVIQ